MTSRGPALLTCALLGALTCLPQESKGLRLPPCHAKAGASEACMVRHGDYPAMKAHTKDAKPNPHDPYLGEVP